MQHYDYAEISEAAVVYFIRDNLEKNKTKIELIKLAEQHRYKTILQNLLIPFEYLGDEQKEIQKINLTFRYLNTEHCVTNKEDWRNFINDLIDKFCLTFSVKRISDNKHTYYYLPGKLDYIDQ